MLSPIRFAQSSTSLTVPERSRREGRLFAVILSEAKNLALLAQGKLREEPALVVLKDDEILRRPDGITRDSSERRRRGVLLKRERRFGPSAEFHGRFDA